MRSCIQRIFKTATAACSFSRPCLACTRFCKSSLLTAATKGRSFKRLWPKRFRTSRSKSSNARIRQKGSRSCRSGGSSNAPSPALHSPLHQTTFDGASGSFRSTDAGDWPRILKTSAAMPWHSCVSPQSGSCSESFVMHNQLLGPTHRHGCNHEQSARDRAELETRRLEGGRLLQRRVKPPEVAHRLEVSRTSVWRWERAPAAADRRREEAIGRSARCGRLGIRICHRV
jgi:hypothetical protein